MDLAQRMKQRLAHDRNLAQRMKRGRDKKYAERELIAEEEYRRQVIRDAYNSPEDYDAARGLEPGPDGPFFV